MKTSVAIAFLLVATAPVALFGSSSSDKKIEEAAKASYNYRTVLEDRVKVTAHDGVVTLTGVVQDEDDKALALATVENLQGVTSVKNEIMVTPSASEHSDAWIAMKLRSQLLMKSNVSATATTVAVKDGVVTLSGTAENPEQKELTEVYAKEIDGVKAVKNEIAVRGNVAMSSTIGETIDDASITAQVKYALLKNKATSALRTNVTTTNGVVAITGEVSSDAEKSLVAKLAKDIRGVKSIDNNVIVRS
jgi:hyperosmotically inducible protein